MMMRNRNYGRLAALGAALLFGAAPVSAQLPSASASTLALAGNNTANVQTIGAISVNPAGLGTEGSGFTLALLPIQLQTGLSPIKLGDVYEYQGILLPDATKEQWLTMVEAAGGQSGRVGAEVSGIALTMGNFGFQLSTVASGDFMLPVGIVEAGLFGNAGRTGMPADLSLVEASIQSFAVTTAGASLAFPVSPQLVLGVTGKYMKGHALAVGRSTSGALEADPIRATMEFALVSSCMDELGCEQDFVNGGSGVGLDFGAMLDLGSIRLGASVQNVVNTFAWDETKLGYRPGTLMVDDGTTESDFDEQSFENAPTDLKEIVRAYTFDPGYRIGAAMDVNSALTLTADIHGELGDGIALGPKYHTGVGAELRVAILQLRAGLSKVSDAMQYGGGVAVVLGPVNVSLAGGLRRGEVRDSAMGQFVLSFGGR